jgi:hypothetical protein
MNPIVIVFIIVFVITIAIRIFLDLRANRKCKERDIARAIEFYSQFHEKEESEGLHISLDRGDHWFRIENTHPYGKEMITNIKTFRNTLKNENYIESSVDWYREAYKFKIGATEKYGSYVLLSLDNEQTWLAREYIDGKMIIKGYVEDIFPGLIKHLDALDNLITYHKKRGTITQNNIEEAKTILDDLDIKVVKKE